VTVRERDSMQQIRMPVDRLVDELRARIAAGRVGVVA
jgi:glycyl-tRNA synthetase (class II)